MDINRKRAFYCAMGTLDRIMVDITVRKKRPEVEDLNKVGLFFTEPYQEARQAFHLFVTIVSNQAVELDNPTATALHYHVNHIIELSEEVFHNDQ